MTQMLDQRLGAVGDDPDELREILDACLGQLTEGIEKLKAAIASGNARDIALTAHSCVGVSATCGMSAVAAPLREMERLGRENDLAPAAQLLEEIMKEFARTRRFLEERFEQVPA